MSLRQSVAPQSLPPIRGAVEQSTIRRRRAVDGGDRSCLCDGQLSTVEDETAKVVCLSVYPSVRRPDAESDSEVDRDCRRAVTRQPPGHSIAREPAAAAADGSEIIPRRWVPRNWRSNADRRCRRPTDRLIATG